MTIDETLKQLQAQIKDLLESQKYAVLMPRFKIGQKVWVRAHKEHYSSIGGFYITKADQSLGESLEEVTVESLTLKHKSYEDKSIVTVYHLNRYYLAPNHLQEDDIFLTKADAEEQLSEKFNAALDTWNRARQSERDEELRRAKAILEKHETVSQATN